MYSFNPHFPSSLFTFVTEHETAKNYFVFSSLSLSPIILLMTRRFFFFLWVHSNNVKNNMRGIILMLKKEEGLLMLEKEEEWVCDELYAIVLAYEVVFTAILSKAEWWIIFSHSISICTTSQCISEMRNCHIYSVLRNQWYGNYIIVIVFRSVFESRAHLQFSPAILYGLYTVFYTWNHNWLSINVPIIKHY